MVQALQAARWPLTSVFSSPRFCVSERTHTTSRSFARHRLFLASRKVWTASWILSLFYPMQTPLTESAGRSDGANTFLLWLNGIFQAVQARYPNKFKVLITANMGLHDVRTISFEYLGGSTSLSVDRHAVMLRDACQSVQSVMERSGLPGMPSLGLPNKRRCFH